MAERRIRIGATSRRIDAVRRAGALLFLGCLIGVISGRGAVAAIEHGYREGKIASRFGAAGTDRPFQDGLGAFPEPGCDFCGPGDREFRRGFETAARKGITDFSLCDDLNLTNRAGCTAYVQRTFVERAGAAFDPGGP